MPQQPDLAMEGFTFYSLIEEHPLEIPIIQRDYAQGRNSASRVRHSFVTALYNSLTDTRHPPLDLDFIYGSVKEGHFQPLDGQQRLTTLFLLHWYLACKDGQSAAFQQKMLCPAGKVRFTYSIRPSSKDFFHALTGYDWTENISNEAPDYSISAPSLSALITDESWFHQAWRLDPTVASALNMLDAIHLQFAKEEGCYHTLTGDKAPTFRKLDIGVLGLSDDLYIKMNSRGMPLTPFEEFKAAFLVRIDQIFSSIPCRSLPSLKNEKVSERDYFSHRIDGAWADLFWSSSELDPMDDSFMNLFRVLAMVTASETALAELRDEKKPAPTIDDYNRLGCLDERLVKNLTLLLDNWVDEDPNKEGPHYHIQAVHSSEKAATASASGEPASPSTAKKISQCPYFDEAVLFRQISTAPLGLSYSELVIVYGYIAYIRNWPPGSLALQSQPFAEWMRVVRNLAHNTAYNKVEDVLKSFEGLENLIPTSNKILQTLAATQPPEKAPFNTQQYREEILKARLLNGPQKDTWAKLIHRAEQHPYFQGQIEFLLQFSGVLKASLAPEKSPWSNTEEAHLQNQFQRYFHLATWMFDQNGLTKLPTEREEYLWERALLIYGDYLLELRSNFSFLDTGSRDASWSRLLQGSMSGPNDLGEPQPSDQGAELNNEDKRAYQKKRAYLKSLWDQLATLSPSLAEKPCPEDAKKEDMEPVIQALTHIIQHPITTHDDDPSWNWRRLFVECPAAIGYCERREARWQDDAIYLLATTQMKGKHAELETFHLWHHELKVPGLESLPPFTNYEYKETRITDDEPRIQAAWPKNAPKIAFTFQITHDPAAPSGTFRIQLETQDDTLRNACKEALQKEPTLQKPVSSANDTPITLSYHVSKDNIPTFLNTLAQFLAQQQNTNASAPGAQPTPPNNTLSNSAILSQDTVSPAPETPVNN